MAMDPSKAEQAVLARYKERGDRAGGIQAGFGMRAKAIRYLTPEGAAASSAMATVPMAARMRARVTMWRDFRMGLCSFLFC